MSSPADLPQRVRTALMLGGVFLLLELLAAVSLSGRLLLALAIGGAVVLAAWELCQFSRYSWRGILPLGAPAVFPLLWATITLVVDGSIGSPYGSMFFGCALGALAWGLLLVMDARDGLESAQRSAFTLGVGFVLVGLGGGSFAALALCPHSVSLTLWLIMVVCCNDIAAYFGGSRFGGRKLAPNLSPKKTISGSLCGFGGGLFGAWLVSSFGSLLNPLFALRGIDVIGLALLVVAGAQVGDLLKSFLKRVYGVKDSGTLLPGHGGVLDRLDGLLGGAPLLLGWIMWRSL